MGHPRKNVHAPFRDRDELNSGVLGEELRQRLENSKFLIVICSPNSAQSEWVSDEVQAFIDMGRLEYIIPFIVDGEPQNYADIKLVEHPTLLRECLPYALRTWNTEHPKDSLLGIAIADDGQTNKQKAFIRVVSRMLGVSFDTLWQRHKRELRNIISLASIVVIIVVLLSYWLMLPVNLKVTIESNPSVLPDMDSGILNVNGNEYTIAHPDTTIEVGNLPGYYRMKSINVSFKADRFYIDENSQIKVTCGISQAETLTLHRDSTFAFFAGFVFTENKDGEYVPVENALFTVANRTVTTDSRGYFKVTFPLSEQTETKQISVSKESYQTIIRNDEVPSRELKYLLHKK